MVHIHEIQYRVSHTERILPTRASFAFPHKHGVKVFLYGRNRSKGHWPLDTLQTARDLSGEGHVLGTTLCTVRQSHEDLQPITEYYVPTLNGNGTIAHGSQYTQKITLPDMTTRLHRLPNVEGMACSGIEILHGTAALLTNADDPFVLFYLEKRGTRLSRLIASRCDAESLENGLVRAAVTMLGGDNNAENIFTYVACAATKFGMPRRIFQSSQEAGLPEKNFYWDKINSYTEMEPGSTTEHRWWSRSRAMATHYDSRNETNMMIVTHNA